MYTSENFLIESKIAYLSNKMALNDIPLNSQISNVVIKSGNLLSTWDRYHCKQNNKCVKDVDVIFALTDVIVSALTALDTIRSNEALHILDNQLLSEVDRLGGRNKWIEAMFGISVDSYTSI